jgi:hypothetical protein
MWTDVWKRTRHVTNLSNNGGCGGWWIAGWSHHITWSEEWMKADRVFLDGFCCFWMGSELDLEWQEAKITLLYQCAYICNACLTHMVHLVPMMTQQFEQQIYSSWKLILPPYWPFAYNFNRSSYSKTIMQVLSILFCLLHALLPRHLAITQ